MTPPRPLLLLASVRGEYYDNASHCLIIIDESFECLQRRAKSLFVDPFFKDTLTKLSLNGRLYGHFGKFEELIGRLTDGQSNDLQHEGYCLLNDEGSAAEVLARLERADERLGLARMDYVNLDLYDYGFGFSGCEKHFSDEIETPLLDDAVLRALTDALPREGKAPCCPEVAA